MSVINKSENEIILNKNYKVGFADAENDQAFLDQCYLSTGDLDILLNTEDPRRIIVGRTGTGKTALLNQIVKSQDNVIELPPEVLSISHISNSNIIAFFEEVGLKRLEEFYVLLWKHVITVELLRKKFDIHNEHKQQNFIDRIILSANSDKKKAFNYVKSFGEEFWQETQYRVKEITQNIERELKSSLGATHQGVELSAESAKRLNETQKAEIASTAIKAVDKIQLRELHNIIDWLKDDVFNDSQQKFYLLIDRLDEDWILDEQLKYKLIKALIETVRSFSKIRNVKIIVTIRNDLLDRVVKNTCGEGFQYEKYESQLLRLRWSEKDLEKLLDIRVRELFRKRYQKNSNISLKDIVSDKEIDRVSPIKYILDRTFYRPREAIMFFNCCLEAADGNSKITKTIIQKAEHSYSKSRLQELYTEWGSNYPALKSYLEFFKNKRRQFKFEEVTWQEIEQLALSIACNDNQIEDPSKKYADACYTNERDSKKLCGELPYKVFSTLYELGFLGIKQSNYEKTRWSYIDDPTISEAEIISDSLFSIHPAYWLVLGIRPKSDKH